MMNYDDRQIRDALQHLTAGDVARSYSGKTGCACGCRGNYSERNSTKSLVLSQLKQTWRSTDVVWSDVGLDLDGRFFFAVDTETRARTVYLTKEATERLSHLVDEKVAS